MKKLLLSISAICFALAVTAQVSITPESGSTDISGSIQNVHVNDGQGTVTTFVKYHVVNNSGADYDNLIIRRVLLTPLPYTSSSQNWNDQVCWGEIGDPFGQCYDSEGTSWTLIEGLEVPAGGQAELKPQMLNAENQEGMSRVRYYVLNNSTVLDSVDVQWNSAVLSVKETPEISVSVYPNPVASYLTIAPEGFDGTYSIRMTDVLGKVIYDERAAGTKKIDVSDFRNGVYIVTVMSNGEALQTKRIVVKH